MLKQDEDSNELIDSESILPLSDERNIELEELDTQDQDGRESSVAGGLLVLAGTLIVIGLTAASQIDTVDSDEWDQMTEDEILQFVLSVIKKTDEDTEGLRQTLFDMRRQAYESELTIQARRVGCKRTGKLTNSSILQELNQMSIDDATSINNTYDRDMERAVEQILSDNPGVSSKNLISDLNTWGNNRNSWKASQVTQYTESTARSEALADFYRFNDITGVARLLPRVAVCPICAGWITRGEVPLREATNNPPPYHLNCPHYWRTRMGKVAKSECPNLWMGEN